MILLALGVNAHFTAYLFLFLVSSIAAVIPVTIGGVGARELVYLYGHQYLAIDEKTGVAFTLLFFLITATSSLTGVLIPSGSFSVGRIPEYEHLGN